MKKITSKDNKVYKLCTRLASRKYRDTYGQFLVEGENKLAVEEVIRKGIQLFVTTSKNKEGININNEDIHHVYIEEHSLTDIRQMAGRLRCGADHAYVIVDSQGHNTYEHPQERWLTRQMCAFDLDWNDIDILEPNIHNQADAMLGYKCAQNGVRKLVGNPQSK